MFHFCNKDPDFWIQLKGNASGKPLRKPIPNSVGIKVDKKLLFPDFLFLTLEYLYQSEKFSPYIIGSVVPYIRQSSIKLVIMQHFISIGTLITIPAFELSTNLTGAPDAEISPQGRGTLK